MRALLFLLHDAVSTLNMAGDAILSALWRLTFYDAVITRSLFDVVRKFLVFNHAKLQENEYKSLVNSSALYNNIFVQIWIFVSTSFGKHVLEPFEPLETFVGVSD